MKLRDIAQAAGTSLTTVSLVLNDKPGVSPEKREQIQQMLRDNGYEIRSAKASEGNGGKTICFLKYSKHAHLVNGNPGFVTQIMDAVEKDCRRRGYSLMISTFDDFGHIDLGETLTKPSVLGAILLGTELDNEDMQHFKGLDMPMVVVDNSLPLLPYSTVTMDNRSAVFSAVSHLAEQGHRHIGFLYNSIPSNNDRERRKAFEDALTFYGLPFSEEMVFPVFPTMDGAMESVTELLHQGRRFPAALVGNNDTIAFGALRAFQEAGLHIPEDISLTGFDGLPISSISQPPLTTVNVPCSEIGAWAVRLLHEIIKGRCTTPSKIQVETQLICRGSTTPWRPARQHPSLFTGDTI